MTDEAGLIARVGAAAVRGIKLLAQGLIVLLLGLIAAVSAIAGAAARLTGELLSELARLLQAAIPWLVSLSPWLARSGVAAAACYAVIIIWPGVFLAYSADMPALPAGALATAVVVCPIALAVAARRWGALLGAIAVMLIIGHGLIIAGPLIRAFAVVLVMAAMAMTTIFTTGTTGETDNEFRGNDQERWDGADQEPASGHPDTGDRLHDLELPPDHDGR